MKNFKRSALASLTATVILCGSMGVNASAEQNYMRIVVSDISANGQAGEDVYSINLNSEKVLVCIDETDIEQLCTSGELAYDVIQLPTELEGAADISFYNDQMFRGEGYAYAVALDENGSIANKYFVQLDSDTNELEIIGRPAVNEYAAITTDGYAVQYELITELVDDMNKFTLTFNITSPEGEVSTAQLTDLYGYSFWLPRHNEDFITVVTLEGLEKNYLDMGRDFFHEAGFYKIYMDGTVEKIATEPMNGWSDCCSGENYLYMYIYNMPRAYEKVYMYETGETYSLTSIEPSLYRAAEEKFASEFTEFSGISSLGERAYGNNAIAKFAVNGTNYFALIDLESGTVLSDIYLTMGTEDGEIYLVEDLDGNWGYLNSTGEQIAEFDDAGAFIGDYAPVLEDGKAYLIDRNMTRVTDEIDADGVSSLSNGKLFLVRVEDVYYLATYAAADETIEDEPATDKPITDEPIVDDPITDETITDAPIVDEPIEDKPTTDAPIIDEPVVDSNNNDKTSPDTGMGGIAGAAAISITALGAAVLSKKRK